MAECIYKTCDGHCTKHSDEEALEYCVEGPCTDEALPEPPEEVLRGENDS